MGGRLDGWVDGLLEGPMGWQIIMSERVEAGVVEGTSWSMGRKMDGWVGYLDVWTRGQGRGHMGEWMGSWVCTAGGG